jgi:tRNA (cmo5U34)-methyltransferase
MNFDADYGKQFTQGAAQIIIGYDLLFRLANSFLETTLPQQAEILVVGAGGGKEIVTFGSGHPGWRFIGVDPAAQMLDFARAQAEQQGMTERVRLVHGYTDDLPADVQADAATCLYVFPFVHGDEAKLATLRAIYARLKPGAPLILVTVVEESFRDDFRAIWRAFLADNGMSPEAVATRDASVRANIQSIASARMLELLGEAGFSEAVPFFRALWFSGWFVWKRKA